MWVDLWKAKLFSLKRDHSASYVFFFMWGSDAQIDTEISSGSKKYPTASSSLVSQILAWILLGIRSERKSVVSNITAKVGLMWGSFGFPSLQLEKLIFGATLSLSLDYA